MQSRPTLSVIIPVLNEADQLPRLLAQLRAQADIELEIIVADGGSRDASVEIAKTEGARVVQCERGRGRQMNGGAAQAVNDHLLFLHADSGLQEDDLLNQAFVAWRCEQANNPVPVAGHFRLAFADTDARHQRVYRYMEAKSASNRRQTINGDQGLLINESFFNKLGGFDESFPLMEDQDMAARIAEQGSWMLLPGELVTSARRFKSEGLWRRYLLMAIMMACYWTGNRSFFERARGLYPAQASARRLRLWPFCKLLLAQLHGSGVKKASRQLYRFGRYSRENSWQLFFFLDVLLAGKRRIGNAGLTRFHDRFVGPLLSNPVGDAFAAFLVGLTFVGLIIPLSLITDPAATETPGGLANDNPR